MRVLQSVAAGEMASFQFTPCYAAPEVLQAYVNKEQIPVHPSVDIWALGVIVYEVLTGAPALQTCKNVEEVIAHAAGEKAYPWEAAANADFDQSNVRHLIRECLRRNPELRPTAAQLRAAVDAMGRSDGGSAVSRSATPNATLAARSALATETMRTATRPGDMATLNR